MLSAGSNNHKHIKCTFHVEVCEGSRSAVTWSCWYATSTHRLTATDGATLTDVRVYHGADLSTDHCLLEGKIRLKLKKSVHNQTTGWSCQLYLTFLHLV